MAGPTVVERVVDQGVPHFDQIADESYRIETQRLTISTLNDCLVFPLRADLVVG